MVLKFSIIFVIYDFSLFMLKSTFWSKFIIFYLFLYILSKELYESLLFIKRCFCYSVVFFSVLNKLFFFIFWEILVMFATILPLFFFFFFRWILICFASFFLEVFLYFLVNIWLIKFVDIFIHTHEKIHFWIYIIHKVLILIKGNIFVIPF